jgi:hypothetical protein
LSAERVLHDSPQEKERQMAEGAEQKKPLLELHLLDEATKKQVIECIQKRGKISLMVDQKATINLEGGRDGGFTQVD